MKSILSLTFFSLFLYANETLVLGATSPVESHLMEQKLTPLIKYLEEKTDKKIIFKTGYNYEDTIDKFADGTFDIGFIGPSPYIKTREKNPEALLLLAELKNSDESASRSVIISKKGSSIDSLAELENKSLAFASPHSTLSYYVPMNMLIDSDILKTVKKYSFLERHDKVAQYVIMGKYDVGAVKKSVADKYAKYLQSVQVSEVYPEFLMVANSNTDKELVKKIKKALLELKDKEVLKSIQSSAIGFKEANSSRYSKLEELMKKVDNAVKR